MSMTSGMGWSSSLMESGIDLAVRVTALLVLTLLTWWAVGRRRPLIGSAIGHAGLLGLLLLPFSARLAPALPIAILQAEPVTPRPAPHPDIASITSPSVSDPPALSPLTEVRYSPISSQSPQPAVLISPGLESSLPSRFSFSVDLSLVVVATYASICVLLLVRLAGSLLGVVRLRRSSVAVDDRCWLETLERHRCRLGINRAVALARSGRVGVPVVVGWLRPMILLPASPAVADSAEHAEAILLHELAHVRRGDFAWNVLLRVVEAIYWPHPLAWLLARTIAESRERACDAFCVHQMGGPSAYRAALLAMAEGLTRRHASPALGLAMASPSRLGRRVLEINRGSGESRCLPRWPARVAIFAFALLATATVGPARLTRAEPRPLPVPVAPGQEPKKLAEPVRPPGAGRVFRLRVVAAETGKPVPKADVRVWMSLRDNEWRKTDDDGRLEIVYATARDDRSFSVDAWGDGFAMQRHAWGEDPNLPIPDEGTIKLQAGESLGGMVQDEEGRPVAGAVVYLWSHNYKRKDPTELLFDLRAVTGADGRWHTGGAPQTTGEILGIYITHPEYLSDREYMANRQKPSIEELRAGKAVSLVKKGVPIEGRVLGADGRPIAGAMVISTNNERDLFNGLDKFLVKTDAEGRFRTGQVKSGQWALVIRAKGHAPALRELKVGTAIPNEEIRLEAAHSFRARVVDPEGKPIEGAFVNVDTWKRYRCLGIYLYSDADGRVRWDDAPSDSLILNIDQPNYLGLFQIKAEVDTDNVFTLKPSLAVSGIVRDAETRKGVENADIEYGAIDTKTGEVASWQKPPKLGWVWYSSGYLNARFPVEAAAYQLRITADGYQPFISRPFRREEKVVTHYDVSLLPGRMAGPMATALRPDGRPLAGARVYRIRGDDHTSLLNGKLQGQAGGRQTLTGDDGTFAIPRDSDPTLVMIVADDCYAYEWTKALNETPRLQARSYGRIEGRFLIGSRPFTNRPIGLTGRLSTGLNGSLGMSYQQTAMTDADGRFIFERVIPSSYLHVVRSDPEETPRRFWSIGEPVRVEDGQTTVVTIGGKGRPVVGRIEQPDAWKQPIDFTERSEVRLESNLTHQPYPLELLRGKTSLDDQGWMNWSRTWPSTPEGVAYTNNRIAITVALAPDGTFRIDDIPPGEYRVEFWINESWHGGERGPFTSMTRTITIPPIPGGRTDDPFDLGSLRLKLRATSTPKVGDMAPSFEVTTVDGKKLAIPGDFRGKFLLLDLGTLWDDQSRLQVVRMNDVFARFGKDERLALLSLLMAADRPESRAFVAGKGEPWPQAIVGPLANPIAEAYGVESNQFPAAILIGPEGRIVGMDLHYREIGQAIAEGLGIKEPVPKP